MYDPRHKTALEFNNRFDDLVERIRRRKVLPEQDEKENYLFAVEKYAKDVQTMEFTKFNQDKVGYSVADLKDLLISLESRGKETTCREENKEGAAMYLSAASVRSTMTDGSAKPFTKPNYQCGYMPDGHFEDTCPFPSLIYCYGCLMHTNHVRKDCPYDRQKTRRPRNDRVVSRE